MHRIYVASSWRNPLQPEIVNTLREIGHQVYDFRNPPSGVPGFAWSELDPEWLNWSAEAYRAHLTTHPVAARGFVTDMRGMQWADTCLLVLPAGRSAHLEAGWFCGQGKRCIILTRDGEEPELMALMATDICVSMQEVIEALAEEHPCGNRTNRANGKLKRLAAHRQYFADEDARSREEYAYRNDPERRNEQTPEEEAYDLYCIGMQWSDQPVMDFATWQATQPAGNVA